MSKLVADVLAQLDPFGPGQKYGALTLAAFLGLLLWALWFLLGRRGK